MIYVDFWFLYLFFFCFWKWKSFSELISPMQAWNISRLRPAPPFNPFLSEYLKNNLHTTSTRMNGNRNSGKQGSVGSGVISPGGGSSNTLLGTSSNSTTSIGSNCINNNNNVYVTSSVSSEDDFALLSIVDSFCNKNRLTGNVLILGR
jgi:hypothetical protein